ncbi:ROK family protein [Lysobacter xanthus]
MAQGSTRRGTDDRGLHGGARLGRVTVDSYGLNVRGDDGAFVGDRASETGFLQILDRVRRRDRIGKDPFGAGRGPDTDKALLERVLLGGDPDASHLLHIAVEEYAQGFADVVRFFLAKPQWEGVERIVVGGGFPFKGFGGLAVRRTARIVRTRRVPVELQVLGQDLDEGGMIGWVHALAPATTRGYQAFLGVDIGGTHVRCAIVEHRLRRAADGSKACATDHMQWRHGDDAPSRDELVLRIAGMLNGLAAEARTLGLSLAPVVGVACPGRIEPDGDLAEGTQNLPGDWSPPFNLPRELAKKLDRIDGRTPEVLMHNDAVVQGLSDAFRVKDARRWGVLTIGTGLGNASYTNR